MDRHLRRAAVAAAALLLAGVTAPSEAAVTQRVANGGFESADAQWTVAAAVVCTATTCGRSAGGGDRFFATGAAPDNAPPDTTTFQIGSATQKVYVPELPATVSFDVRVSGGSAGTQSYLRVFYDNQFVLEPDVPAGSWQTVTASLPDGSANPDAAGTLLLAGFCDNLTNATAACPVVDVDNVKLRTGADTEPPQTRITKGPSASTTSHKATFRFTSSEKGSTFACKVDDSAWKACTSPASQRVSPGSHTFRVRATDASGNTDPTPAKRSWRVLR